MRKQTDLYCFVSAARWSINQRKRQYPWLSNDGCVHSTPKKHCKILINWWKILRLKHSRIRCGGARVAHYKTQCLCLIHGYLSELHGERFPTPEEDEWPRFGKIWFRIISLWHYLKCSGRPWLITVHVHFAINTAEVLRTCV